MEPSYNKTSTVVPVAIIIGFIILAITIYLVNQQKTISFGLKNENTEVEVTDPHLTDGVIKPVDETDYILGNPNAPILIVEYSDYECPFCKRFHTVLGQVMEEYGVGGRVAWVYRHFPIPNLHPNSAMLAETALCVGQLGGNQAFWKFTNKVYEDREPTDFTNITKIPRYIEEAGISLTEHRACMDSGQTKERLSYGVEDAINAGVKGTPYTFITVADQQIIINGAESYQAIKGIISNLIEQLEGDYDIDNATTSTNKIPTTAGGVPIVQ